MWMCVQIDAPDATSFHPLATEACDRSLVSVTPFVPLSAHACPRNFSRRSNKPGAFCAGYSLCDSEAFRWGNSLSLTRKRSNMRIAEVDDSYPKGHWSRAGSRVWSSD